MPIRFTRPEFSVSFQFSLHPQFRYKQKDSAPATPNRAGESPLCDSSSSTQGCDIGTVHAAYNPGFS